MKLRLLLLAALTQLHTCALLDSAKWTVNTTYDPTTKQYGVSIGKEPISSK